MVWIFMGNARMYEALRDYGDRIDTIGLFSFVADKTGTMPSGVAINNNADLHQQMAPHPLAAYPLPMTVQTPSSSTARQYDGAQDKFCSELVRIMEKYPWCSGVDIDLEKAR